MMDLNPSVRLVWLVIPTLATLGCDSERAVRERDVRTFEKLVGAGLEHRDSHVRAETLTVLERLGAPSLAERARSAVDDDSPMVRIAALRALLAGSVPESGRIARRLFSDESGLARLSALRAVVRHGDEELTRHLLRDALAPDQPPELRRWAFEEVFAPRARRALSEGRERMIRRRFVPKMQRYVRRLDRVLAGPILRLLAELEIEGHAEPVLEVFRDSTQPVDRRLRAARILRDGRVGAAEPAFGQLLERARVDPGDTRLELPSRPVDERLVRAATLGLVATGAEGYVPRAKLHLREATTAEYIEVLEALAPNPARGAKLALESAMVSARPRIRRRAIHLYADRRDAESAPYFELLQNEEFDRQNTRTRREIAAVLSQRFPETFRERLRSQLTSSEGKLPGLRRLAHAAEQTEIPGLVGELRDELLQIARNDEGDTVGLALFLLTELPDPPPEVRTLLERTDHLRARYLHLRTVASTDPGAHADRLRANLYPEADEPELFALRLVSGAGLWRIHRAHRGERPATEGSAPSTDGGDRPTDTGSLALPGAGADASRRPGDGRN